MKQKFGMLAHKVGKLIHELQVVSTGGHGAEEDGNRVRDFQRRNAFKYKQLQKKIMMYFLTLFHYH